MVATSFFFLLKFRPPPKKNYPDGTFKLPSRKQTQQKHVTLLKVESSKVPSGKACLNEFLLKKALKTRGVVAKLTFFRVWFPLHLPGAVRQGQGRQEQEQEREEQERPREARHVCGTQPATARSQYRLPPPELRREKSLSMQTKSAPERAKKNPVFFAYRRWWLGMRCVPSPESC